MQGVIDVLRRCLACYLIVLEQNYGRVRSSRDNQEGFGCIPSCILAAEDIRISQRMPMSSKDDVGVGEGLMGSVDSTESDDHG